MAKAVKSVVSVVSTVAGLVLGAQRRYKYSLRGVWEAIKDIWEAIRNNYKKIVDWVNKQLEPIRKWIKQVEDFYKKHIEPWLKRIDKVLTTFIKAYLAWKILIEGKITYLFKVVEEFLKPKVLWLDNVLRHLQQVFSVFSKKIANRIEQVRINIWNATLGKLYNLQRNIMTYVHSVFVPIDRFVYAIQSIKRDHINPLVAGLKGLKEDLSAVIKPDRSPREKFAWETGVIWGKELYRRFLIDTEHWEKIQIEAPKPPSIVWEELEKLAADTPEALPEEEKEIYKALEVEALIL